MILIKHNTRQLGRQGEEMAAQALIAADYLIVARNYQGRWGEIDLIAEKGGCLYFVEVKLQRGGTFGTAAEHVTATKKQRILLQAQHYLAEKGWQGPCGFLIVAIDDGKLEIIEDFLA